MARFLYKAKDKAGRVRSGSVDAASYAEAKKSLVAQGLEVSMLNEAGGPRAEGAPLPVAIEPPAREGNPWPLRLLAGFGLLGAVAMAVWLVPGHKSTGAASDLALQPGEATREVRVRGQVELLRPGSSSRPEELLKDVRITLIFPEVPTEKTLYHSDLEMSSSGAFEGKIFFLSTQPPRQADVSVRAAGFETARKTHLNVTDSQGQLQLEIPRLTMKSRKGYMPVPGQPGDTPAGGDEEVED